MEYTEDLIDDPDFQREIFYAVKVLDAVAKCADDNRVELPFKRKDGMLMIITIEERNDH